ncbi:MAG: hypothetical protein LUH03_11120 [Oscillospiraceae bacterium]|nr:hypothetical protein [Oscillospiraceae bacterium]
MGKKSESGDDAPQKKSEKSGLGTMDIILIIVGASLLCFTVCMIYLFTVYGSIPDTLCSCVFAALGGECGIMGWIKTTKDKRRDREWQKADEAEARQNAKADSPGDDNRDPSEM